MDVKPTVRQIIDLRNQQQGLHEERFAQRRKARSYYDRTFKPFATPPDPRQWKVVIPGTARSKIDSAALQIVTDEPMVKHPARGVSPRAQDEADRKEKWGHAILDNVAELNPVNPFRAAAKEVFFGMWVLKGPLFDFDAWPDPPQRSDYSSDADFKDAQEAYKVDQAENFPFIVEAIDPQSIVWDMDNPRNPSWVIESYTMSLDRVRRQFPHFTNPNGRGPFQSVHVDEYWSRDWRCVIADGEAVSFKVEATGERATGVIENIYHYVPYDLGFGVWGRFTADPADADKSALFAAEDLIIEEARVKSIKSWTIQRFGMTAIVSDDPETTRQELAQGPAPVLSRGPNGKGPEPMPMPDSPTWLDREMAEIQNDITQQTFTQSLAGQRQTGTTSALMEGVLIGEAQRVFGPIRHDLEAAARKILNRCALIHEQLIGEPMSIWAKKPGGSRELITVPSSIWKGTANFTVKLDPTDPTRDDRRAMLGLNLEVQGALDPWTITEDFYRYPNANEILMRKLVWEVMQTPEFKSVLVKVAAEEMGLQQEIAQLMAQGQGGQPGAGQSAGDFQVLGSNLNPSIPGDGTNNQSPPQPGSAEQLAQSVMTRGQQMPQQQGAVGPVTAAQVPFNSIQSQIARVTR